MSKRTGYVSHIVGKTPIKQQAYCWIDPVFFIRVHFDPVEHCIPPDASNSPWSNRAVQSFARRKYYHFSWVWPYYHFHDWGMISNRTCLVIMASCFEGFQNLFSLRLVFASQDRNVHFALVVGKIPALIGSPHVEWSRFEDGSQNWKVGGSWYVNVLKVPYRLERVCKIHSILQTFEKQNSSTA